MTKSTQRPEDRPIDHSSANPSEGQSSGNDRPTGKGRKGKKTGQPKKKRKGFSLITLLVIGAGMYGGLSFARYQFVKQLPDPASALTFQRRGTLTLKSSDGEVLQKVGPSTQEPLRLAQMPDRIVKAFVASEDRRFYEHTGVDYTSIARAIAANVTAGSVVEGGSTLTQQVARIAFLDMDQTLTRKLKEALLAQEIEAKLTKNQIMERYLNLVYLGSGAYGVADAAWIFFGKSVQELTLGEAAMIAGLPPAPSLYNPVINPKFAQERRAVVLARMVEAGFISQSEADQANKEPVKAKPQSPKYLSSRSPYFTTHVQKELAKLLTKDQLESGGLTVETTLNFKWQDHAEKTLVSVVQNEGVYEGFDQAAMTVIDPRTGEIRVMVGGADFGKSQFNRVTQAQRQPGSTFKPFVYATAIASGLSPYDTFQDNPFSIEGYQPKNFGNRYSGTVDMTHALTKSINTVAVKALIEVGFNPVIKMVRSMGIESKIEPTYSMALGSWEVNLLELVSAYGTFANQGQHIPAHSITRITDRSGKVLFDASKKFKATQVLEKNAASIMDWMLRNVVNEGTGAPAILADRDVAGKTGTSEKARDLWFIGFIPQYVGGVWLGNDDDYPTAGSSGTAAMLWHEVMMELTKGLGVEEFPKPDFDNHKASIKRDPVKAAPILAAPPPPENNQSQGGGYYDQGGGQSQGGYDQGGQSQGGYDQGGQSQGGGYSDPAPADNGGGYSGGYSDPAPAPVDNGGGGYSGGGDSGGGYSGGGYSDPAPAPAPAPEPPYELAPPPPEPPPVEAPPPPPPPEPPL